MYQKSCDVNNRYMMTQHINNFKDIPRSDFNPLRVKPFYHYNDQLIFDLGDLQLVAISVRGHTPGMKCELIVEERIILFGDACGVGTLLIFDESSSVNEYKQSLLYLKTYESRYDKVIRNHGTGVSNKIILDNVIALWDLILTNKDEQIRVARHGIHCFIFSAVDEKGKRIDGVEGNLYYK